MARQRDGRQIRKCIGMSRMKEIEISGSPYERGLSYGRQCAAEIAETIAGYRALFEDRKGLSWSEAVSFAAPYADATRAFKPEYAEEMRGIAAGAGVPAGDVETINARSEILADRAHAAGSYPDECTAFSVLGSRTRSETPLAGQNWDYCPVMRPVLTAVHIRYDKGSGRPDILLFAEAGLIGGVGMNSAGITVTINALPAFDRGDAAGGKSGITLRARMRYVLESTFLAQAYEHGAVEPLSAGNLLITSGDGTGAALDIESDSDEADVILPDNGIIVHTNHFTGDLLKLRYPHASRGSTYVRLERMKELLSSAEGITPEDMEMMLRDHVGFPCGICVHANEKAPEIRRNSTNFSVVMDPAGGCAYLAPGNPCGSEFEKYYV